jgi:membrane fusion protein (multidrug efflux system)
LTGCKKESESKTATAQAGVPPAVVVAPAQKLDVPIHYEYVGRTEANATVDIRARVEAVLEEWLYKDGTPVKKGQVLYRLDKRTFAAAAQSAEAAVAKAAADLELALGQVKLKEAEANLAQANARLDKANKDVARLEPLVAEKAVPVQDLDAATAQQEVARQEVEARKADITNVKLVTKVAIDETRAALSSAEAKLAQADLDLEYCEIRSPIDGLAGINQVSVGNLVGRGQATLLTTVSALHPIWLNFAISESDYLRFVGKNPAGQDRPNIDLELILADNSVFPHKGRIRAVERTLSKETGTLSVIGEFPNPDGLLRPQQFGRVRAVVETLTNAIVVPQRAILEVQSAKTVYVVEPGSNKVVLRSVSLGPRHGASVVVTGNVKEGDLVIVEGQIKARPGMTVKPVDKPLTSETSPATGK